MILQNGFQLDGNINTSMIELNDTWTQVLIIESTLEVEQLRELFKDNNLIIESSGDTETTYNTNGLIDIKTQDNKNYVWLYFVNSNINSTNQELKSQLADVLKTDLSFETIKFLYSINQVTKDDIFNYVKNGNITQSDYLTIVGENCPELPLDIVKQIKIDELNKACEERITYEFYSSADGTKKLYDFDDKHQLRIESLKNDIKDGTFTTVTYYAKGEDCHEYTSAQFLQLAQDGTSWVFNNTAKYKELKKYIINNLNNSDEINKITLDTVIPTV